MFKDATFLSILHLHINKGMLNPKTMKKLIVLCFVLLTVFSCSLDNDEQTEFHYEILPVENVQIPQEFMLGETYTITLSYYKPTGCHVFNDIYYKSELNERTVAVINTVYEGQNCSQDPTLEEASFNFMVNSNGSYVFKFWQGEDDNGEDLYYIVEVPVAE